MHVGRIAIRRLVVAVVAALALPLASLTLVAPSAHAAAAHSSTGTHVAAKASTWSKKIGSCSQYGWDRDHAWMKMCNYDRTRSGSTIAKVACTVVVKVKFAAGPCTAIATAIIKKASGTSKSHGVWAEFYPASLKVRSGKY